MTAARALPRPGPSCHCGRPLCFGCDAFDARGHLVTRRCCAAGHTVHIPQHVAPDIDLRPCTSGDLEG